MHLSEIQSSNRKACRGAGSAIWIVLHPKDNRYNETGLILAYLRTGEKISQLSI